MITGLIVFLGFYTQMVAMVFAFDAKRLFHNFTGLGNYSRTFLKNLQSRFPEHEYHLFTPNISNHEETTYFLDSSKFVIHNSSQPLWRTFGMSKEINHLRPDIFHGLSHELPFGLHNSIKKVVTFHDLIYEIYPKQFGFWDRNMYKMKYSRAAIESDFIVSISESTRQDLQNIYKIPENKIKVIYQSCQNVFQHKKIVRSDPNILYDDYYLYVGSLIERKNIHNIIETFSNLDEIYKKPFVIVGSGPKLYVDQVKRKIKHLKLETWFHFLPHVNNSDLVAIYDKSFAMVYPSVYEGFGIPVIESLFRRKPVITSRMSSLPEAAGPGGILVNPLDTEEIKQAMQALHNPDLYQKLSKGGYQYVLENFSSEITAGAMMDFYRQILNK